MPTREWKRFRDALRRLPARSELDAVEAAARYSTELQWRELALRFALPALLAFGLFLFANFAILIPMLEDRRVSGLLKTLPEDHLAIDAAIDLVVHILNARSPHVRADILEDLLGIDGDLSGVGHA